MFHEILRAPLTQTSRLRSPDVARLPFVGGSTQAVTTPLRTPPGRAWLPAEASEATATNTAAAAAATSQFLPRPFAILPSFRTAKRPLPRAHHGPKLLGPVNRAEWPNARHLRGFRTASNPTARDAARPNGVVHGGTMAQRTATSGRSSPSRPPPTAASLSMSTLRPDAERGIVHYG